MDECSRVWMFGIPKHFEDTTIFYDLTGIHYGNPIAGLGHYPHVVGYEQETRSVGSDEVLEEFENLSLDRYVEIGRRFICDYDFGSGNDRHAYHYSLIHSTT